jgi:hypothetical protein
VLFWDVSCCFILRTRPRRLAHAHSHRRAHSLKRTCSRAFVYAHSLTRTRLRALAYAHSLTRTRLRALAHAHSLTRTRIRARTRLTALAYAHSPTRTRLHARPLCYFLDVSCWYCIHTSKWKLHDWRWSPLTIFVFKPHDNDDMAPPYSVQCCWIGKRRKISNNIIFFLNG